jgi:hypothetical protein
MSESRQVEFVLKNDTHHGWFHQWTISRRGLMAVVEDANGYIHRILYKLVQFPHQPGWHRVGGLGGGR